MASQLTRSTTAVALALAVGLLSLPACKKKSKPTPADTPAPAPTPTPTPMPQPQSGTNGAAPNASGLNLPAPPQAPVFGAQDPRVAALRGTAEQNMKQIVFAIMNFESAYATLPSAYADKTGKPGLSWRVAILPFMEQDALFKQFKLDEPWDGPNNSKLIDKMPKLFAPPNQSTYGYTFARGFSGPNTWLGTQKTGTPGRLLLGTKLTAISDGTSNTALIADAGEAVIWTKPDEMVFGPNSVPKVGGVFASGTFVGLADGSVKLVRKNAAPDLWPNIIQINDGSIVKFDD